MSTNKLSAAVVLALAAATVSCGGASGEAETPTSEIASADDSPGEGGELAASQRHSGRGAVLQYMPASCPGGRMYVDTGALLSSQSAQSVLREITSALLDKERDDEDARKVIDAVRKSGFDLATGITEGAMCMGKSDEHHVMAAKLALDDPMGLLNDISIAVGEGAAPIREENGAKVLVHDGFAFIQPAPGIIVMGNLQEAGQARDREGASGFGTAAQHIAFLDMPVEDGGRMVVKLTEQGSQFELWGSLRMTGKTADAIAQHPEEFSVEMRKKLLSETSQLAETPFRVVYKRAQEVKVEAGGDTITASVTFPADDVTVLLKAAAPKLGVNLGGGRLAGGSEVDTVGEILEIIRKKK